MHNRDINALKYCVVLVVICMVMGLMPEAQASKLLTPKLSKFPAKPYFSLFLSKNPARYFSSRVESSYFIPPKKLLRVHSQYLDNPHNVYAATYKDVQPYIYTYNQKKLVNMMTGKWLNTTNMRNTSASATDIQGAGIFVIGAKGELYVGKVPHHDYFTQGREDLSLIDRNVAFAGSIYAVEGTAKCIWMDSGHYRCGAPVDKEELIRPDIQLGSDGRIISMKAGIWDPYENYFHLAKAAEYIMDQQHSDSFYVGFFGGSHIYRATDFIKSFRCKGNRNDLELFEPRIIGISCDSSWMI